MGLEAIVGGWCIHPIMALTTRWKIRDYATEQGGGKNESEAPQNWVMVQEVEPGKATGYLSDPTLLYHDKKLYVYWRENFTDRTKATGNIRATFCKIYSETGVEQVAVPILTEPTKYSDKEMCPTFYVRDGEFLGYGVDYRFSVEKWANRRLLKRMLSVTGKLGIYSQSKSNGVALWTGDSLSGQFHYQKTYPFQNVNKLYKPWHMDLFEYGERMYAVVLTNESLGDICLAESTDGQNFKIFEKPLLTNKTLGCIETYKPTAQVVDGVFYLYYTVRNADNPSLNRLYQVSRPFKELLDELAN